MQLTEICGGEAMGGIVDNSGKLNAEKKIKPAAGPLKSVW